MGAFFGNGVSYTHDYQGEIAFVEVILVKQSQSKRFPFEITPLLTESDETYDYEPAVLTTFSRKQYDSQFGRMKSEPIPAGDGWMGDPAATFNDGPLALALFQPQANSFFGASGNIKLQLPLVPGLSDNLSAAELMIDLVKTEAGHNHTADFNGYITLSRPVQYFDGPHDPLTFFGPLKVLDAKATAMEGDMGGGGLGLGEVMDKWEE